MDLAFIENIMAKTASGELVELCWGCGEPHNPARRAKEIRDDYDSNNEGQVYILKGEEYFCSNECYLSWMERNSKKLNVN